MTYMDSEQMKARAALIKRLEGWPLKHTAVYAERDKLIKEAAGEGMSNTEIAAHMEISRGTVISVLGAEDSKEG
jgi:DNA-binding NarL/FixJ family response regulator